MSKLGEAKKILLIVSGRIGDVIFSTPAIRQLRQVNQNAQIDLLAPTKLAGQVCENNPDLNHVFLSPSKEETKNLSQEYDLFLAFHNNKVCREYISWLDTDVNCVERFDAPTVHLVDRCANLLKTLIDAPLPPLGEYQLFPSDSHFEKAKYLLKSTGLKLDGSEKIIGIHMGCLRIASRGRHFLKRWFLSTRDTKSWPLKNITQLAKSLRKNHPEVHFVLIGTDGEKSLVKYFNPVKEFTHDLIGQTEVLDLAAMMTFFDVFYTADTGPLHVACAMDTSVVTTFGPTKPSRSGPYPPKPTRIVIKRDNMKQISVNEVQTAIESLL